MQIATSNEPLMHSRSNIVAIGVVQDGLKGDPFIESLNAALDNRLFDLCAAQEFTGRAKQQLCVPTWGKLGAKTIALIGLGQKEEQASATLVHFGGAVHRLARSAGAASVALGFSEGIEPSLNWPELVARGIALGGYRYDRFKSEKARASAVKKWLMHSEHLGALDKNAVKRGVKIAQATMLARDLVNAPPNDLYPESFAKRALELAKEVGLKCQVFNPAQLAKKNMNLLLGVGQASAHLPRLVHLSYTPPQRGGKKVPSVAFIGKGITFDSGGLCLKTAEGMLTMKVDMAGAASVLATMWAVAALKLPIAVDGILALAENMPGGNALRPGDVIKSAAGKTVEITNTDAEGRLILADALHYARSLKPRCMIDLATLTGACMVALGPSTTGVFSNDETLAGDVLTAAKKAGEDFWRLPLTPGLKVQLKSEVADMRNSGDRLGGAITAALFLQSFVEKTPWAHLDIAGPSLSSEEAGASSKGASGVGVATLLNYLAPQQG